MNKVLGEVGDMAFGPTLLLIFLEPTQISFPLRTTTVCIFQAALSCKAPSGPSGKTQDTGPASANEPTRLEKQDWTPGFFL